MPEFNIFLMHPTSAFHIGERGVGLEATSRMIHSDTLFGAICWAWRLLHGEDDLLEMLDQFQRRPPFLISSAFPFIGDVYLLPKPLEGMASIESNKKVRKAWLVSRDLFQRMACGNDVNEYEVDMGIVATSGEMERAQTILESRPAWTVDEPPRVTLDRLTMRSEIYHVGELRFAEGCGLYTIVDFRDASIKKKFEATLRLLGDEGVGGEKSAGRGMFCVEKRSISIGADKGLKSMLLSLCHPRREEVSALRDSSYNLVLRRGWVGISYRKKGLRMLSEGSVIPCGSIMGSITEVFSTETMRVYSYGLAFAVAMECGE